MRVFRKNETAAVAVKQTPREKLKYVKKNWQLYVRITMLSKACSEVPGWGLIISDGSCLHRIS